MCGKICTDKYVNERIMRYLRGATIEDKSRKRRLVWYDYVIKRLYIMPLKSI